MEAIGINMHPWLSDQLRYTSKTADGTPYELAFTRDVTDILLMGFHFDTCLSPNSFNFFSTVANAVDLNKRVIYGKTVAGKVIGRCLFALNDRGEILTYHRYSHDPKDGFSDAVDQFVQRLATEMRSSVGIGGKVATHGLLNNHSEFLSVLLRRFGAGMNIRQRFIIAVNVAAKDVRYQLLSRMRWSEIVRLVHCHRCDECDVFHGIAPYERVFQILTQFHPTIGLRAIRAARPTSILDDLQDLNKVRRAALIEAQGRLGRQHLVEQLLQSDIR